MNRCRVSRRAVLRGAGVTLCLPLLESLWPRSARAGKKAGDGPPVRLAVLYMPNGVNPHTWTPSGSGKQFELSPILAPLTPLKGEILVLSELMNAQSVDSEGHYVKVAPFLTGTRVTKSVGSNLRVGGVSMDQLAAQRIGDRTPLPSLELTVEPVSTGVDKNVGYTRVYGSHISWSSPTTPVTRELDPQRAFDRVFRSAGRAAPPPASGAPAGGDERSVLDAVSEDARQLQRRLGSADRLKLDEYFTALRAVEKRIADDARERDPAGGDSPTSRQEVETLGGRIREHAAGSGRRTDHTPQVRLMLDIMVLAFWTDTTRVATFMFGNEVTGRSFSFLPGVRGGHHEISHHGGNRETLRQYERICVWHAEQYAYMLERMRSFREGEGTLLDHAMVLFGSGIRDGEEHSNVNLPIVLAGKAGGTLATGRHLVFEKKTPLCNLYVAMLKRMGAPVERFGDSTGELPGLEDAPLSRIGRAAAAA